MEKQIVRQGDSNTHGYSADPGGAPLRLDAPGGAGMTLYVSDLDGTLLDSGARLSLFTEEALRGLLERGLSFTVATGRTPISALPLLRGLPLRLPAVLMNGALVLDMQTGRYLHTVPFPPDRLSALSQAERSAGLGGLLFAVDGDALTLALGPVRRPVWAGFLTGLPPLVHASAAELTGRRVIYALYMDDAPERLAGMYRRLSAQPGLTLDYYKDIYTAQTWCLEVYSAEASKRRGVEMVRRLTGAERLVGFGDNHNDLPLFAACDEGYAVENACGALKAAADGVIGANTADGVARWLLDHADPDMAALQARMRRQEELK